MTKGVLIDDIELRITRWKPSDDLELERDYIDHLIGVVADDVSSQYLMESYRKEGHIDSNYIRRIYCKSPILEDEDCEDDLYKQYYVNLDFSILPLPDDLGLVRVTSNANQEFHDATNYALDNIKYFKIGNASKDNLLRTREGRKIYLSGISNAFKNHGKIIVWAIPTLDYYDEDDELPFAPELANVILDMVEQKLLRALGIESDLHNDGEDEVEYGSGQ